MPVHIEQSDLYVFSSWFNVIDRVVFDTGGFCSTLLVSADESGVRSVRFRPRSRALDSRLPTLEGSIAGINE